MDKIATLPTKDRAELFRETATRPVLSNAIAEIWDYPLWRSLNSRTSEILWLRIPSIKVPINET